METHTVPTKSFGIVIGAIVIFAVLIFGALYIWGKSIDSSNLTVEDNPSFQVTSSVVTERNLTDEEVDVMQQLDALPPATQSEEELSPVE
ncbi:MAG: hypothetical protein WAX38_03965 [Minisyncoccia bacterium]